MDKKDIIAQCNAACENTLMQTLAMEVVDVATDYVCMRMPVNSKVHQPDGVLHGGASIALAESTGSILAHMFLTDKSVQVRGLEIAGNHVRSVREGFIYAHARFIHKGRTTQLIEIKIQDEEERLVCLSKLTTITLHSQS